MKILANAAKNQILAAMAFVKELFIPNTTVGNAIIDIRGKYDFFSK